MANAIEKIVVHHDHQAESEIRNLPPATASGMPVRYEEHNLKQDIMTVAAGSTAFLSIDPATSKIGITSLAITAVTVNTAHATLAAFIAAEYTVGNEFQEGDVIILTSATDFKQRNWIHNGGTAGTAADFTQLQADLVAADIRAFVEASGVLRYDAGTGVFSVAYGNAANQLGADKIPVDSSLFTTNQSDVSGMLVALEDLIETNEAASTTQTNNLGSRLDTAVGAGAGASNLGSFTGTLKPSVNSSIKVAIQSSVNNLDALATKNALTDTVLGVAAADGNMGAYTDTICPDNASVKSVTQALGTAVQTEISTRTNDVSTLNSTITTNKNNADTAIALRAKLFTQGINLTANVSLQIAHSFSTGYTVEIEDSAGQVVRPQVVKTTTTVTITSEVDLTNAKITLIGY